MQNVITFDYSGVLVGQERKRETHFATVGGAFLNRIDTDRGEMDATLLKIRKPFLKTPQLGVT